MKAWIQTTPDFEYEVVDVLLGLQIGDDVTTAWIKGFDDDEWEQAKSKTTRVAFYFLCRLV